MKKNIFYIPIIIILLIIFVPLSVYSIFLHKKEVREQNGVKVEEGKIAIMNKGVLLFYYTCETDTCNEYSFQIDDTVLDYKYNSNTENVFNNHYIFIYDGVVKLIDLEKQQIVEEFNMVKTYGYTGKYIIAVNKENKYGLYDVEEFKYVIEPTYDFIGTICYDDELNTKLLNVIKDGYSYLIDIYGNEATDKYLEYFYQYNENYYVLVADNMYTLYDINGQKLNGDYDIIKSTLIDDYAIILTDDGVVVIYNGKEKVKTVQSASDYIISDNKVEVYAEGALLDMYTLNNSSKLN